jgi:hypothetical protein
MQNTGCCKAPVIEPARAKDQEIDLFSVYSMLGEQALSAFVRKVGSYLPGRYDMPLADTYKPQNVTGIEMRINAAKLLIGKRFLRKMVAYCPYIRTQSKRI